MVVQILTDSILTTAERLYDLAVANAASLGLADGAPPGDTNVWFGDQDLLPRTPALCVEPGTKHRDLAGFPDMTRGTIDVHMLLYHSRPGGEQQQSRRDCIRFAENVERYFHVNHLNLLNSAGDQIIIHGFFTDIDPGYVYKTGTLYNAVRMTWTGTTKTSLRNPQSPPP